MTDLVLRLLITLLTVLLFGATFAATVMGLVTPLLSLCSLLVCFVGFVCITRNR